MRLRSSFFHFEMWRCGCARVKRPAQAIAFESTSAYNDGPWHWPVKRQNHVVLPEHSATLAQVDPSKGWRLAEHQRTANSG